MRYTIALYVGCNRWLHEEGRQPEMDTQIHFQVRDAKEHRKLVASKTFLNVTPAQAARAVALQNKLGGRNGL